MRVQTVLPPLIPYFTFAPRNTSGSKRWAILQPPMPSPGVLVCGKRDRQRSRSMSQNTSENSSLSILISPENRFVLGGFFRPLLLEAAILLKSIEPSSLRMAKLPTVSLEVAMMFTLDRSPYSGQ